MSGPKQSLRTLLTLANGKSCDLRAPRVEDVDFDAMAEHLAKEARYNGSTPGAFYSVAEHSVRGVTAIFRETGDATLAAYFLLHDGHEALLKDDTTPKKAAIAAEAEAQFGVLGAHIIAAFDAVTDRHDAVIHAAAGLSWPPPDPVRAAIKHWDKRMFVTEWRDLMAGHDHPDWSPYVGIEALEQKIKPWSWGVAEAAFRFACRNYLPRFVAAAGARA